MKPEFLYTISDIRESSVIARTILLKEDVRPALLQWALDAVTERHPWFLNVPVEKPCGVVLRPASGRPRVVEKLEVFGPGTEYPHLIAVTASGRRVSLYAAHMLTDGVGMNVLADDLMVAYTCLCRGREICFRTPAHAAGDEAAGFPDLTAEAETHAFSPLPDGRKALKPEQDSAADGRVAFFSIRSETLMGRVRELGTRPAVLLAVLCARALREQPAGEDPIVCWIPADCRSALGREAFLGVGAPGMAYLIFEKECADRPLEALLREQGEALKSQLLTERIRTQVGYRQQLEREAEGRPMKEAALRLILSGVLNTPKSFTFTYLRSGCDPVCAETVESVLSYSPENALTGVAVVEALGSFHIVLPESQADALIGECSRAGLEPSAAAAESLPVPVFRRGLDDRRPFTKHYSAGVLTPVHMTDPALLRRAFESLRKQSFGFDNIEWTVLLHNCTEEYKKEIAGMLGAYANVNLCTADRPGTGVAWARNACFREASAKYLFFLDSDDEMRADCIEKTVEAMEQSGADIGTFTAEAVSDRGVDWIWIDADPAKGTQILDRSDPAYGKVLCMGAMSLWCNCYRRSFLEEKGLRFDESLSSSEDTTFAVEAACAASRIAALPWLCGYTYSLGHGMLSRMIPEFLRNFSSLTDRWQETASGAGVDLTNMLWYAVASVIRMYVYRGCPDEARRAFFAWLGGFVRKMPPPAMNWPMKQQDADRLRNFLTVLAAG